MSARANTTRGVAMVAVVSSLALAAGVAMAGLVIARRLADSGSSLESVAGASAAARGALEAALESAVNAKAWRNAPSVPTRIGLADISAMAEDPADGDLMDDYDDSVRLTVRATQGEARRMLRALLSPNLKPHASMEYGLCVLGNMTGTAGSLVTTGRTYVGGTLSAPGTVLPVGATNGYVIGLSMSAPAAFGAVTAASSPATLPKPTDIVSGLAVMATRLTTTSSISGVLLSKSSNPLGGGLSAAGLYVIGTGTENIMIENCRINACLIIEASRLTIGAGVVIDPPAGLPALVVIGDARAEGDGARLSEASAGRNFNPLGSPFEGVSDIDQLDSYSAEIEGLVYVSGSFAVNGRLSVNGPVLVRGNVTLSGSLTVRWSSVASGPLGFRASPAFTVQRGSLERVCE